MNNRLPVDKLNNKDKQLYDFRNWTLQEINDVKYKKKIQANFWCQFSETYKMIQNVIKLEILNEIFERWTY